MLVACTTCSTIRLSFIVIGLGATVGPVIYIPLFIEALSVNTIVTDVAALVTDVAVVDSVILTVDNQTMTFTNPAQGFVLPVSVVQVTAVAGGITAASLIALH